ncbi:hypothetical protein ACLB4W_003580 [Vibrio cholerae]|uniref:hypothetical protein n=1 Tax=Vibrio cholerae TaxID=666 RepID=UPI000BA99C69|nr:hypothetical protein [Vibrio cholerae]EGR1837189.1 hypothetical protein [Vibrio cholerae]EGR4436920.1 hypothetical protein [Vibrio cholerae]EHE0026462.1 hypothetical protein [Vibrio cholerae]EHZ7431704.1 hypothetical protein [Vibrio cholerae]EJL6275432.1 hypothetical protein [Vibrio cholerae]
MENDREIEQLAYELIELKRQIKALLNQEKLLKEEIKPLLQKHGAVKFDYGKVYYGESKGSSTFSRPEVLSYIRDNYGDALADQIDEDCTKVGEPKQVVYIKLNDS